MQASSREPSRRERPVAILAAALLAACAACGGSGDRVPSSLTVERDTVGDTVVVRTLAGSVWGDSVRLVEELRVGELDGGDEYTFGQVREFAVGRDGTMYVYDAAVKALRAYDSTGAYLRTIGGDGAGPGEYREAVGLAILPDGRLLLRDPRVGRIVSYTAAGDPHGAWPSQGGLYISDALTTDSAGLVYSKILTGDIRSGEPWPLGYLRMDSAGAVVDTVHAPRWPEETGNTTFYDPTSLWTWHPHGYLVAAFGSRYAVELRRPGGPVLRIERANQPRISVSAAERAELTEMEADRRRRSGPPGRGGEREVPGEKPFIREIDVGGDGRIWVRPYTESVERTGPVDTTLPLSDRPRRWTEATVWDVFEPDGTFLGRIPFPPRATILAMRGSQAWGTVLDENDVPYLVRWRIEAGADPTLR
jgi:hypothetical protein